MRGRVRVFIKVGLLLELVLVVVVEAVGVVVVEMVVVVEGLVLGGQIRPGEPSNILILSAVDVLHTPQSACANNDAPENMSTISVTLDTSHLEMSPLNDDAEENMAHMLVTLETSHSEISPLNDEAE